jgi:transcriptional activator HAC1
LELQNLELKAQLEQQKQENMILLQELHRARLAAGGPTPLRPTGVTLSPELFSSHGGHNPVMAAPACIEELLASVSNNETVNPASLSPALTPVPEDEEEDTPATVATPLAEAATLASANPTDTTQHPAVMLCEGLQCRSVEDSRLPVTCSQQATLQPALAQLLPLQVFMMASSAMTSLCQRPLMQIALSLKAGFSLRPTPSIMITILWLVMNRATSTPASTCSTSTTSSATTSSRLLALFTSNNNFSSTASSSAAQPSTTRRTASYSSLRLKFLRKVLTCSPNLARPLMDATMAALRLASTENTKVSGVSERADDWSAMAAAIGGGSASSPQLELSGDSNSEKAWFDGTAPLPSKEALMTLLWALRVEEKRFARKRERASSFSSATKNTISGKKVKLVVASSKKLGRRSGLSGAPIATTRP